VGEARAAIGDSSPRRKERFPAVVAALGDDPADTSDSPDRCWFGCTGLALTSSVMRAVLACLASTEPWIWPR
jgi:hypothetical protein